MDSPFVFYFQFPVERMINIGFLMPNMYYLIVFLHAG